MSRTFTIFAAASLLLLAGAAVVWVRSYRVYSRVVYARTEAGAGSLSADWYTVDVSCGGVQFKYQNRTATTPNEVGNLTSWTKPFLGLTLRQWQGKGEVHYPSSFDDNALGNLAERLGFSAGRFVADTRSITGSQRIDQVTMPFWAIVLLLAILPSWWIARYRSAGRTVGCCSVCGYDLRATPERCPECGAVPSGAG